MNLNLKQRLKGGLKGGLAGLATGNPIAAAYGAGAGFVAPGLTGDSSKGFFATDGMDVNPFNDPKTPGMGKYGTENKEQLMGGSGNGDSGNMSDVRARIEELRRQQYAQRTKNLEQVMAYFGPVNQELKNIYGVDMPANPFAMAAGQPPSRVTPPGDMTPPPPPSRVTPVTEVMLPSPFAKAPTKRYIGTGSLPQNYPGTADTPEEIAKQGGTGRSPKQRAGDWKSGPRYG